jgi:hypothetical protein
VLDEFLAALTYVGQIPGVKHDLTPRENLAASRALTTMEPAMPADHAAAGGMILISTHHPLDLADTAAQRMRLGQAFCAMLGRDIRLAIRQRGELAQPLVFFAAVAALFPLALGPEPALLEWIATGHHLGGGPAAHGAHVPPRLRGRNA